MTPLAAIIFTAFAVLILTFLAWQVHATGGFR